MDAIRQYMTGRAMDAEMQARVLDYYDYMWERNKGVDVKNLFEDMPSTFRNEVALSLNRAIIDKLYLFTADEYVVHRGDLGLEMYFITQGRIDVFLEDLKRPIASLIEGAHFGEFQIVLGIKHEYSARAVCNSDIYVLRKQDIEAAFEAYPDDHKIVLSATKERYQQALIARPRRSVAATHFEEDSDASNRPPAQLAESAGAGNEPSTATQPLSSLDEFGLGLGEDIDSVLRGTEAAAAARASLVASPRVGRRSPANRMSRRSLVPSTGVSRARKFSQASAAVSQPVSPPAMSPRASIQQTDER
ncbi:hypothetical protein HK405_002799 [Cladochytrium tenue]|nr:hypothetical protein HK405_002799 [Cladochytrium tenue]